MNLMDFTDTPEIDWSEIEALQRKVLCEYEPEIFERLNLSGFDINSRQDQELVKKFIQRITEEMCEAEEAFRVLRENPGVEKTSQLRTHVVEELVDAFNFLVEMYFILGREFDWSAFQEGLGQEEPVPTRFEVIFELGLAGNKLKNREWRRSQYPVDLLIFDRHLRNSTRCLGQCFAQMGVLTRGEVASRWARKNEVNRFRIASKY